MASHVTLSQFICYNNETTPVEAQNGELFSS